MNVKSLPKVDAHTHLFYDRDYLVPLMEEWNMRALVINITGEGLFEEPMAGRWEAMHELRERHPERFALCASFDPADVIEHGSAAPVVEHLEKRLQQGATVVKVWKDLGLVVQDEDGTYVQIDDARFQPVWDVLTDRGMPLIVHAAEPRAAWQPLDRESPHFRYFRDHPEHHLYKRSDVPEWETIIAARDRWIGQNPDLTIVGAHFGSMAHDLDLVAERLERYPNFYVDTTERFGDLITQPSDKVRGFMTRYADRVIYGTDVITDCPVEEVDESQRRRERDAYDDLLAQHARYFAGEEETMMQDQLVEPVRVQGLDLPDEVLAQIYEQNARRVYDITAPAS